jgi:excisionase family DNA binding protein
MSDYLTAKQAGDLVGCSDTYIRSLIDSGELNAVMKQRRWRILRADVEALEMGEERPSERASERTSEQPNERRDQPGSERTKQPANERTNEWRDDLLAQLARLEADKVAADERGAALCEEASLREEALRVETDRREQAGAEREERSKARIIDLERAATMREGRIADMESSHDAVVATHATEVTELRGQVAVLEAKVRETLEAHTEKLGDLASNIAELANAKAQMELRVYELEPVACQVPMLQAAVEEKDATLSDRERELQLREHELGNVRDDIEAIASRPMTGPVFRLLTRGKLRI